MPLSKHLLDIIDNVNSTSLPKNTFLVNFDIVNMLSSIDNNSRQGAGKSA